MKNNWKDSLENWILDCASASYLVSEENGDPLLLKANISGAIAFVENLLAEQKKELLENERKFILNILDGIDIADKEMGVIGGTQAIRQALQSRVI